MVLCVVCFWGGGVLGPVVWASAVVLCCCHSLGRAPGSIIETEREDGAGVQGIGHRSVDEVLRARVCVCVCVESTTDQCLCLSCSCWFWALVALRHPCVCV